ncbi:MAG: SH3 domain-containing protein [Myxococcales bacterium]|nr:SH3 domain-containing protein [Myxococcales bacterium]
MLARRSLLALALTTTALLAGCAVEGGGQIDLEGADESGDGYGAESVVGSVAVGAVLRATTTVNLRNGPSTSNTILHVIPNGATVTVVGTTPKSGFYNVKHAGVTGWAYGLYFEKVSSPTPPPAPTPGSTTVDTIKNLAATSACAKYSWKDRGLAPKGYVKGVALTFAKAVCQPTRSDVVLASKAKTTDDVHDALSWFASNYAAAGMSNTTAGVDTLRHLYTLLLGLGMRESSGEHCVGRDASASNVSADSAEAGAWQTSYDSRSSSVELSKLFTKYRASSAGCFLDTFREGVSCSAADWKNWGTGTDGLDFQRIEKACPAFAAEYAAVMLRVQGGSKGHYGPLRTKAAEIRPECDAMLKQVQAAVASDPTVCSAL